MILGTVKTDIMSAYKQAQLIYIFMRVKWPAFMKIHSRISKYSCVRIGSIFIEYCMQASNTFIKVIFGAQDVTINIVV